MEKGCWGISWKKKKKTPITSGLFSPVRLSPYLGVSGEEHRRAFHIQTQMGQFVQMAWVMVGAGLPGVPSK